MHQTRALRRLSKVIATVAFLALAAGACGDDGGEVASPAAAESNDSTTTAASPSEPVRGGEAVVLVPSDGSTLDPVRMNGSSDGQRGFALYGALVVLDSQKSEIKNVLAESFTPNAANDVWTLVLKPGITFSDGTPYDAEAVKFNWERIQVPDNRSPSLGTMRAITSMTVEGSTSLTIALDEPNAHFDRSIARVGGNFIGSPTAIQNGEDLTSKAVGAGPFLLDNWLRDDRMDLRANPDWKGSDGPFVDRLTLRVVPDEDRRTDTFTTGSADAFHTAVPASVARATKQVDGAVHVAAEVPGSGTLVFNTTKAPFDDVRVRTAFVHAVEWQGADEAAYGEGAESLATFVSSDSVWHNPDAVLPSHDPDAAQALIDEYLADTGNSEVHIVISTFQTPVQAAVAKFAQTALDQLDNVRVEVEINDSGTQVQKVRQMEHMVSTWGIPHVDPEPGLFLVTHSSSTTNYSGYSTPQMDAALEAGRVSTDFDERKRSYDAVYEILAENLPYFPYFKAVNGYVTAPKLKGAEIYEDGQLRTDLIWLEP